jgi:hypothetical protein
VDGIRTFDDMKQYVKELGELPLLYNGQLLPVSETATMGFRLMINSSTLLTFYLRMRDAMRELKSTGAITNSSEPGAFGELTSLLGVPEALALGKKYEHQT